MTLPSCLAANEKEALLIMFGSLWQKKYWSLDGQAGRPSLSNCVDFALRKSNAKAREDLVDYVEKYLTDMARRCNKSAKKDLELVQNI